VFPFLFNIIAPFQADRPPPDTESEINPAFIISQRWIKSYVAVEFMAETYTATSPVGPAAPVAKLVPAQAFHMITPITLFYPVLAKWTWHRVLADPMEREFIDFIVTSRLANRGLHPRTEGPAHYPQDIALANSHATEGTGRTCVTAGRFLLLRPPDEARPAASVLAGG
jgi:hypothetical protein